MRTHGTRVVGAVTFGQGGTWCAGVPVFDTVKEAVHATDANASLVCVPASEVMEALLEAVDAGLRVIVCVTSHVPARDMVRVNAYLLNARNVAYAEDSPGAQTGVPGAPRGTRSYGERKQVYLIGPGSPGVFSPGKCIVGAMPGHVAKPGSIGVLSRSGSLAYEVTWLLTRSGIGQSTILGIGDGLIVGTGFAEVLAMFEDDPSTEQIVIVGEIGGQEEEMAAAFIADRLTKPVVAFIVGQTAPPGRRMGHQGAVIEGYEGTAQLKIDALEKAGVRVARTLDEIPRLLERG
jgi:succinyl-CoA synthetase alpha subunit